MPLRQNMIYTKTNISKKIKFYKNNTDQFHINPHQIWLITLSWKVRFWQTVEIGSVECTTCLNYFLGAVMYALALHAHDEGMRL